VIISHPTSQTWNVDGETSLTLGEATPWFTVGFGKKGHKREQKRAEMTRNHCSTLSPNPVPGPPKPSLFVKTVRKEEKFGTERGDPTVKRVVGGPLCAA